MAEQDRTQLRYVPRLTPFWCVVFAIALVGLVASGDDGTGSTEDRDDAQVATGGCTGCLVPLWTDVLSAGTQEELTSGAEALLDEIAANATAEEAVSLGLEGRTSLGAGEATGYSFDELKAFTTLARSYTGEISPEQGLAELTAVEQSVSPEVRVFTDRAQVDLLARGLALDPTNATLADALADAVAAREPNEEFSAEDIALYAGLADYANAKASGDLAGATAITERLADQVHGADVAPVTRTIVEDAIEESSDG